MLNFLKTILLISVGIFISGYFILTTNSGLHVVADGIKYFLPGKLSISSLEGKLNSGIAIEDLRYQSTEATVSITSLKIDWTLKDLFKHGLVINKIIVQDVLVKILETKNTRKKPQIPNLRWLKLIKIHELAINHIIIENTNQPTISIHDLEIQPKENNYYVRANLNMETALAKLTGLVGERWNLAWQITIPDLKKIIPEGKGKINGSGKIQGTGENLRAIGTLHADNFAYDNISAHSLHTQVFAKWIDRKAFADLSIQQLNINGFQIPTIHIKGNMDVTGELEHPTVSFHAALQESQLYIPQLKVQLKNIIAKADYQLTQSIKFSGTFRSGEGRGSVIGTFEPEKDGTPVELKIDGKNLLAINLPEYKITISPQLMLTYKDHETNIKGDLLNTSARITPADFSAMTILPEEVVIIDKETKGNAVPQNLSLDVQLSLAKDTYVAYENLKTKLNGQLFITKKIGSLPTASGELYTVEGQYKAYGRTLKINQGRVIYTGNLISNPGLDIKASKEIETLAFAEDQSQFAKDRQTESIYQGSKKIKVGVLVKGTLKKPYVSFFSNPAGIEQNDILSYLIFGYPRSRIKDMSSLSMLSDIISSVNMGPSHVAQITKKIKKTLGLSRVSMTSVESIDLKTNKSEMNTALNIEKNLGKKFSIQYRMGLFHALYVLNLKYRINKLFSIQSETSNTDKGADLLFEYEHD